MNSMQKYDIKIDMENANDSHSKILSGIKPNSTILEFGPAAGAMTKYLKHELNCKVYIVEFDEGYYSQAIRHAVDGLLGDACKLVWLDKFMNIEFDFVIFADVLEHLYNPQIVLDKAVSLLKDDGKVILSVPNVAHSSIIMNLLNNKFEYRDEGLLDDTHIRFFTYDSAIEMVRCAGLMPVIEDAVYLPPQQTEYGDDFDAALYTVDVIKNKKHGTAYQFVIEAVKLEYFKRNKIKTTNIKNPENAEILEIPSLFSSLFYDFGEGYSEATRKAYHLKDGRFCKNIDIPHGVLGIRFDPVEGIPCIIKNLDIISNLGYVKYTSNGFAFGEYHVFLTKDSQIEIILPPGATNLSIEATILTYDSSIIAGLLSRALELKTELPETSLISPPPPNYAENIKDIVSDDIQDDAHDGVHEDVQEISLIQINKPLVSVSDFKINRAKDEMLQAFTVAEYKAPASNKISDEIRYNIDVCKLEGETLTVEAWLFAADKPITDVQLNIFVQDIKYEASAKYGLQRNDVFKAYKDKYPISKFVGLHAKVNISSPYDFDVFLEFKCDEESNKVFLKRIIQPSINKINLFTPHIRRLLSGDLTSDIPSTKISYDSGISDISIHEWLSNNFSQQIAEYNYPGEVDIIIPVYNGYDYLAPLFKSLGQTKLKYNLVVVEDCSTDDRIRPYLNRLKQLSDAINVTIIENEENLGFVKSVNKALDSAKNHVVLLNTDTELPNLWLERLMYPILFKENVASVTPFTNAGTICSFPEICDDNELFENLSLGQIDESFSRIKPQYTHMPTGVGFCMALNIDVIREIGTFDAESFQKGYGEENDWCQRAIKAGYVNVMAENLFVYHKHGGSFLSEEKEALIKRNSEALLSKHPNYNKDVQEYISADPVKNIRNFVAMNLLSAVKNLAQKQILVFDHNIGGGATEYLNNMVATKLDDGYSFMTIRYMIESNNYSFLYQSAEHSFAYTLESLSVLRNVLDYFSCSEIIINELVTYPNTFETLEQITKIKQQQKAKLSYRLHDYYCICPSYILLNNQEVYCNIPSNEICEKCSMDMGLQIDYGSMTEWRKNWKEFMDRCDEIIAFSNSSKEIYEKAYGRNNNLLVIPHQVDYINRINKGKKTTNTLNIGLLGALPIHKGSKIVQQMVDLIEQHNLNVKIVLMGYTDGNVSESYCFKILGKYERKDIPELTIQNDIDIFFVSSIWPETFTYTAEEVMKMDMPLACFKLGAPAERVAKYHKGLVIEKICPKFALAEILTYAEENVL